MRVWYNDAAANSRVEDGYDTLYLVPGNALSPTAGAGPKLTVDTFAKGKCGEYVTIGTWSEAT